MSKTTNRLSPQLRARALRLFLDTRVHHAWAALSSITAKIGYTGQTL
ncbi:hypothetical protein NKH09_10635 [Mesorhizobium sp. M1339]